MTEAILTIEIMGAKGDGLTTHEGQRLAVAYALPGERVRARLEGERAECLEVLSPSPERATPICPHFSSCGGCVVQHWQAEPTTEWKRARVALALARAGLEVPVEAVRAAHGEGRRRVTLHVRRKEGVAAGFMRARSHELIDLDACPLLVAELAPAPEIAREIGQILRGIEKPLDVQFTATLDGLDADIRGAGPVNEGLRLKLVSLAMARNLARLTLHGERLMEARVPRVALEGTGMTAFIPPGAFLQPTAEGEATLAALAAEGLAGAKHLVETFCGLGPFGLRLMGKMKVTAFDSDKGAIEAFARSIRANPGGKPCVAEARDLFRRPLFFSELKPFDAILLDPPRQGAEAQMREIAKSKIGRMVYVSCDPESFARDAKTAVDAGFKLTRVTPVDQFKYSSHVELVAVFGR